jgi:hypothetical protein
MSFVLLSDCVSKLRAPLPAPARAADNELIAAESKYAE